MKKILFAALAGAAFLSTPASAAVTFDPASGTGFVGKGDVQLALGLNNAQVQVATLNFAAVSTVITETSWTCTNTNNQNVQERARTTTTSIQGVVSSVARVKNQITGYTLSGYNGTPTSSSTTEGPQLNSCPTNWVFTASGESTEEGSSVLTVNGTELQ